MKNKSFALKVSAKLLCVLFLTIASAACVWAQTETVSKSHEHWNPQKTWVFIVGMLKWQDSKNFVSFPQKNRRDLILLDVLRQKGVPENQVVYLKDKAATTEQIQTTFESFLTKAKPDDWVFVYYEGHGFKDEAGEVFLASYNAGIKNNAGWKVESIPATIEKYFKGNHALLALDNCHSGAIVDAVKKRRSRISYAAFASTPANSSSTGNWTFTESLINAFRGDALVDINHDGGISLGEMINNASDDMLFAEEQVAQFALTGDFDKQTFITKAKGTISQRLGERIEAFDGEDWYRAIITDVKNGAFKVHYYGYEFEEDEYVTAKNIRWAPPKQFKVGDAVEAESDGEWYKAHVLNVKGGAHLVSYDEYDESENEWLPSDQIRKRKRARQKN